MVRECVCAFEHWTKEVLFFDIHDGRMVSRISANGFITTGWCQGSVGFFVTIGPNELNVLRRCALAQTVSLDGQPWCAAITNDEQQIAIGMYDGQCV